MIAGVRPENFEDAALASDAPENERIKVKVDLVEPIGTETLLHFDAKAPVAVTEEMKELAADVGVETDMSADAAREGRNEFVAEVNPQSKIQEDESAELRIDTARLHFFDPESNRGIYDDE